MDPYLIQTLSGIGGITLGAIILALGLPKLGRWLDRRGW